MITEVKKSNLSVEFYNFLCSNFTDMEKNEDDNLYTEVVLQINILVAFYFNIFGTTDKKFIKRLLDLNKKVITTSFNERKYSFGSILGSSIYSNWECFVVS